MAKVKYTDSTTNRPYGERIIDANFVFSDLEAYTKQIQHEKDWKDSDRNAITIFKNPPITIVLMALKKKAKIEDNEVNGFLTLQVLEGCIEVITAEGTTEVKSQQLITIHPSVHHSINARKESLILLTSFHQAEDNVS